MAPVDWCPAHRSLAGAIGACIALSGSAMGQGNPIVAENSFPGSSEWVLNRPASTGLRCPADSSCAATPQGEPAIEGFASSTSVAHGQNISFYVNTSEPGYTLAIYRIGWYGGSGGRLMMPPIRRTGTRQPIPVPDPLTGLAECQWSDPFTVTIPDTWTTGVYLAVLTAEVTGFQSYIHFVVRDDRRDADFLFQCSVTTYQAYNCWGGKSLYYWHSTGCTPAHKVSFDRPYSSSWGAGEFFFWEINMVRWLEREGYDVAYCTDLDTHEHGDLLPRHRGFLVVGHDEYWSRAMRTHVEAARDHGVHLAFFTANACYWQVRFEPSAHSGSPNRTMVGYKHDALTHDPYAIDANPLNDGEITVRWRQWPVLKPEDALIGVMFDPPLLVKPPSDRDIIVVHPEHWIFAGTGVTHGSSIPGLLGNEMDRIFPSSPTNLPLAHSPVMEDGEMRGYSDMTLYYDPGSRAMVFAAGTLQWPWGLDSFIGSISHTPRESDVAKQMTRNLLAGLLRPPVLDVVPQRDSPSLEAWPLPFRPRLGSLTFRVPSQSAEDLWVTIYDVQGRPIAKRVARPRGAALAGMWDGMDDFGRPVPTGIYLLRSSAGQLRIPVLD